MCTYVVLLWAQFLLITWFLFFPVGVQIGFEQTSYTVHEGDKSVTVCAVKTAGDIVTPVPVTVFTVDGLSAQGMHTHISTLLSSHGYYLT